jgi:hypothetical protein
MTDNGFNLVRSSLARKESSVTSVGQSEPSKEEIKVRQRSAALLIINY